MAAGDTIPGQIRVRRNKTDGGQPRVLGPYSQNQVDYHNTDVSPEEKIYVNTWVQMRTAPSGAQKVKSDRVLFNPGETLLVEHQAASLEEAIDHDDPDLATIEVVITDLNTGEQFPRTLDVNDQELSSNPTSSKSGWVPIFEFTVPDRQEMLIAGQFGIIAPENA
jgi:hypothetical protein